MSATTVRLTREQVQGAGSGRKNSRGPVSLTQGAERLAVVERYRAAASDAFLAGDYSTARGRLAQAVRLGEPSAGLLLDLAAALDACGNTAEGIRAVDVAEQMQGRSGYSFVLRASLLHGSGALAEALPFYTRACAMAPNDARFHLARGCCLLDLAQPSEAAQSLLRAVQLRPNWGVALSEAASALASCGCLEDAYSLACQAVDLLPNDAGARITRGSVLQDLGMHKEALAEYDRALLLSPHDPDALVGRAIVYRSMGNFPAAHADIDAAESIDSSTRGALSGIFSLAAVAARREGIARVREPIDISSTGSAIA